METLTGNLPLLCTLTGVVGILYSLIMAGIMAVWPSWQWMISGR